MRAYDILGTGKLHGLALVQVFQRDLVNLLFIFSFPWPAWPRTAPKARRHTSHASHTSHHLRQDVVKVDAACTRSSTALKG